MTGVDLIGFAAGGFVTLAFYCRRALPLRLFAITSNVLFVCYAAQAEVLPVLILHLLLLPLNLIRLVQEWRDTPLAKDAPIPDVVWRRAPRPGPLRAPR